MSRLAAQPQFIALAVLLGLATSMCLAWSGARFGRAGVPTETRWHDPGGHDWSFRLWPSPTQDLALLSLEAWPPGSAAPPTPSELRAVDAVPHAAWRRLIAASAPASGDGAYWDLRAFGWPCKCLAAGSLTVLSARPPTPLGSVSFQLHPGGTVRTFPATPIWGGLLVDSAAFAVPWWLAILGMATGVRAIRAGWRRRRGRCPACGYDVRATPGSVCPECGAASKRSGSGPGT